MALFSRITLKSYVFGLSFASLIFFSMWSVMRPTSGQWKNRAYELTIPEHEQVFVPIKNLRSKNIFYNRVGKCGSRSLIAVINTLSHKNKFKVMSSNDMKNSRPKGTDLLQEVLTIGKLKPPSFYNRHIHYIDFKKYNLEQPIYINMIRDPIARFSSQYNYLKYGDNDHSLKYPNKDRQHINACVMNKSGMCNSTFMFYMGLYFCGMDPVCTRMDEESVKLAKKHLDNEYVFVGMLEEYNTTLYLLENILPEYFSGAKRAAFLNQRTKKQTATKIKDILSEEAKEQLRTDSLAAEYEVYNHAKKKFDALKKQFGI